ncbi:beta-glucosidase [Vallitalea longa]|uniref:Beta-glucosidase n=1 Tax=Vallitalea longa TaxID=2936439 RepID=A0A9W5YEU4_9FIRM|nr:glycoside hydrolase family 3 C-terminal domain-containing protein [Vallitalea longa]GKX29908.1 beta-glucosidase [Vallitalea longa]
MFKKNCILTDEQINNKVTDLMNKLTLKEKVWLLNGNWDMIQNSIEYGNAYNPIPIKSNGNDRLDIPPIAFTDGPRGVVMGHSTCFPVSMARGASFDRELEKEIGNVIGIEARAGGANYFAGVCINLLRHPAWGRAQETYGEDPFLLGEMGKALTESVQEHNVMACIKHYAVNNIENSRFKVNIECDERTLREVYLPHFKKCVEAGAASLMGSYNKFRGEQCSESYHLLTKILRDEWGFEGFTSSDFLFAIRDTKKAIEAGMDIEMPMPVYYQQNLLDLVQQGVVSEDIINLSATRVIKTVLTFSNSKDSMEYDEKLIANEKHTELARKVAEKSMVLIKNKDDVLPFIKDIKKVLIVGKLATKANTGDYGSSRIYAPYVVTQLEGLQNYFGNQVDIIYCDDIEVEQAKDLATEVDCVIIFAGNDYRDEGEYVAPDEDVSMEDIIVEGYKNQGQIEKLMSMQSKRNDKKSSYTDNSGDTMGGDRSNLSLKESEINVIKEIGSINPNTVVCLIGGSMIMTKEWDDSVPAIMYSWYSGMEGGNALPRILFGDVNPSGKLPFTVPTDGDHLPYFSSTDKEISYDLYHGYTLLDKENHKPAYPFGFGLCYTSYRYSDMVLEKKDGLVDVKVRVTNIGKVDGEEIIQVYVGVINSMIERQKKLLKGFDKVFIKSGETKEISIPINIKELYYFSSESMNWELEHGIYKFMVGPSSDETTLLKKELRL